jgi:hypothetical protein
MQCVQLLIRTILAEILRDFSQSQPTNMHKCSFHMIYYSSHTQVSVYIIQALVKEEKF